MDSVNAKCIGTYCGRVLDRQGNLSDCGACPSGYRVDSDGICQKCTGVPSFYDWMYLLFMAISSLGLHWFFIDFTCRRKTWLNLVLHVSAFVECVLAAVCSLLIMEPRGLLSLTSCPTVELSDWYTLFYNPSPDYVHFVYCTQEAVYPLYTLMFIYYAFNLLILLLIRPLLSAKLVQHTGTKSIYAALYFLPILVCIHAVIAGFIYYSFPFVVIVVSMATNAIHFSHFHHQASWELLKIHVTNKRNLVVLACHWLLHAFGIVAVTQLQEPLLHSCLLLLIPLPALFYILTVRYTNPDTVDEVS